MTLGRTPLSRALHGRRQLGGSHALDPQAHRGQGRLGRRRRPGRRRRLPGPRLARARMRVLRRRLSLPPLNSPAPHLGSRTQLQELDGVKRCLKEMEEAATLREMQAKVAQEMQGLVAMML